MLTLSIDAETYYDREYSLRRMTPVEYILDPRFEMIGVSIADMKKRPVWIDGPKVPQLLDNLRDKKVAMVSHNALFDMCVLAFRYRYVPALMIDTMGMARAMLAHELKGVSLDRVAQHLTLGVKGHTVLQVAGMNREAIIAAGLMPQYAEYCCNDNGLCRGIFQTLMRRGFPPAELLIMDTVLRCAVEPKFQLDPAVLAEHLHAVRTDKANLLARTGLDSRDALMSNDKFADVLRSLGVEPPTKTSLTTGKQTYAFAKTDADFIELEEHEDPMVQALVAARMGLKTTLEETRTQRFINISTLTWPGRNTQRVMPVPLRYSGAHTHRLSGDWKLNLQNLSRANKNIPGSGRLRRALKAPEGCVTLSVDSSQVEARTNAWFSGETALVAMFAAGADVYSGFAEVVFSMPVTRANNPMERFVGKQAILGLGYGMGWPKFAKQIVKDARLQLGRAIEMPDEEAARIVGVYRKTYPAIVRMWRRLNDAIPFMLEPDCHIEIGPVVLKHKHIALPSGLCIHYHDLRYEMKDGKGEWWYTYGVKNKRIYGAKMLENIIQALARICTFNSAVAIRQRFERLEDDGSLGLALQAHDELVYVVPEDMANVCQAIVLEEMRRRPVWAPDLPLDAEAGYGPTYGDAK